MANRKCANVFCYCGDIIGFRSGAVDSAIATGVDGVSS